MKERLLSWCRYYYDACAFRWMMWRRFRAWRDGPRKISRHRERMEQWAKRNRFMRIGEVKKSNSKATDRRDASEYNRNTLNK